MAIVTSGSVTAAGRLLGRSQPVVSRQISDLEHELGFMLFARTRPTITLTPQGEDFYQEVRSVLADLQQLAARAQDIAAGQTRPLRVMVTADLAHGVLPAALARVDAVSPVFQQKLIVEEVLHEQVSTALVDGMADFALINLPIDYEQCRPHWCGQAPCLLALPSAHPLAGQDTIRLESLGGTDVITLLGRYRMRYHLTNALVRATDAYPRRHIEASSSLVALSMVRAGMGVALIDPFTAHGARLDRLVIRPIDVHIPYMIGAVSHQSRRLPEEALLLIEGVRTYIYEQIPNFVETGTDGLPIGSARGPHASHTS